MQYPEIQPPEYCLVRIVDVKVDPGKTYRYRLQVEMANPNYKRTDVASPVYSDPPTLPTSDWYEIPGVVTVPLDMHYYAVDQKDLDGRNYKGPNADARILAHQVPLQIHRWLEKVDTASRRNAFIGEWIVGERIIVGKGEYVGRTQLTEFPVWMENRAAFVIPKKREGQKEVYGMPVSFASTPYDSVLVDFTGGETRHDVTEIKDEKPVKTSLIRDTQRTEVLLCTPDGRLLGLDAAIEAKDPQREARLETYRNRVKDVKANKGMTPMGPGSTGPFSN